MIRAKLRDEPCISLAACAALITSRVNFMVVNCPRGVLSGGVTVSEDELPGGEFARGELHGGEFIGGFIDATACVSA